MFLKVNPKVLKAVLMGNVERCDKTLPTNEMIYHVRVTPRCGHAGSPTSRAWPASSV